ncbi:putative vancomycin response regulator [Gottschalkia acidurici 9a]|uniref:Vancomycin response regulator n=1 Tax=Gottschalkia acidurici (strain ATCC 7906 / DSM 604 / BCRC 14475 / CIP 104303 / KCTC 5404 / NCIMB 10678 / 9a) TaxID=1128398 RepID=K0AWH0_GOTA9|nr:response regulator transcription factor [Gottschalkia acidurici]AFS77579.1 putative vancomycin response regulator [Gottschalkia acidurici 9a]
MSDKILIVDDEREVAGLIDLYLQNESYTVYKCYDAKQALKFIDTTDLDLVILNITMPGISGLTICQKIREKYNYPIIIITAKRKEVDKIMGLTLGADDCINKPFIPLELMARIKAQLRRYKKYNIPQEPEDKLIIHSGLVLNVNTHECLLNEKPLILTPTEFSILRILCEEKGNVVSGEELFIRIWKDEYFTKSNNTVAVHIRNLREKMNDSIENSKYIKTIWGVGYKIEK